jgi:hypothetical protein
VFDHCLYLLQCCCHMAGEPVETGHLCRQKVLHSHKCNPTAATVSLYWECRLAAVKNTTVVQAAQPITA